MATTAKRVKDAKKNAEALKSREKARATGERTMFTSRQHNRCQNCGRPRAYLRKFGLCRLCFRLLALRGDIPGVSKSSW
jgi:small subunit ribosomal protein S14